MSVELAVLAPMLALLLLLLAAGARVVEVQGHIDGAARDAARAASIAQDPAEARQYALQAAQGDLGTTSWCVPGTVGIPHLTGFQASGPVAANGAGGIAESDVTVTVQCTVNMSAFSVFGFNAHWAFSGTAVAPLDPFVCREAAC